jgi:hypothetical protein
MTNLTKDESASFNPAELNSFENTMNMRFARWRKDRSFRLAVSSDAEALEVTLTLSNESQTFFYPVQSRLLHRTQNVSLQDSFTFLLEYIESYFEEFFLNDEGVYLPIDWTDCEYDGINFQIKGQIQNLLMESLADKLLAGESIDF